MRPLYFLVGHPFGDPANEETILEGPLSTQEIANAALEAHLLNGGQSARVVCLAERVEPTRFVLCLNDDCVEALDERGIREIGTLEEVSAEVPPWRDAGHEPRVYGLVPVKAEG